MSKDVSYTNGVVAVKETSLLNDKLLKLIEGTYEEGIKTLSECGFFKGAEDVSDFEPYLRAAEEETDSFIREYASPSAAAYLLAPRDFHNAKACVKARLTATDAESMLAPDGLYPAAKIKECVESGNFDELKEVGKPCKEILDRAEEESVSGAEIGIIFERAMYSYLLSACRLNLRLTGFIKKKIDMANILGAVRGGEDQFISGGKLTLEDIKRIVNSDKPEEPYKEFTEACLKAKHEGLPPVEGERIAESLESEYFYSRRFELKAREPVTYYALRRRAEIKNVRIILTCLSAGLGEAEIKKRLRGII